MGVDDHRAAADSAAEVTPTRLRCPLALVGGMALWGLAGTQLRFKHISDFKFLLVNVLTVQWEPCRPRPLQHLREYSRQHHGQVQIQLQVPDDGPRT